MSKILPATMIAAVTALCGCADTPNADADYGSSVRQMVQEQTYDPIAAANPPERAPEIGDGIRLQNAIEEYRKDIAKGQEDMKAPIIFEVAD